MQTATFSSPVPVFGIDKSEEAKKHYIDWLGFTLDWEWREAPGKPVIMHISRGEVAIMMNQAAPEAKGSNLTIQVSDLKSYKDELNKRKPGSAKLIVGPPYDIPSMYVTDPFGNFIDFQQPIGPEEEKARLKRADEMRVIVNTLRSAGEPFPTPEQLVENVGRPLGIAIQVLNEFPDYKPSD